MCYHIEVVRWYLLSELVLIAMWVHLFPSRTQKLSTCAPTILGGRLPGKIGNANTEPHYFGSEVFVILFLELRTTDIG